MIVSPTAPISETIARLTAGQNGVIAKLPEINDAFRKIVKGMGYSWDADRRYWYRTIDDTSGPISDRLLETASALFGAGFILDLDKNLTDRLKAGDWQPEHKRWVIQAGERLGLRWRGDNENLYRRALMLPESHWDHDYKAVSVPPLYFGEVHGFAEEHGFRFTPQARACADKAEREYQRMVLPTIAEPAPAAPGRKKRQHNACEAGRFLDLPQRHVETLTSLMPHQVPAVEKILPMRLGGLFMDMGTGKTRCAIEIVARRQQRISRVVWFCPVSLKLTIAAEIAKHSTGESVYIFDDTTSEAGAPDVFWYIVGIESMSSSDRVVLAVRKLIDGDTFAVVDESSYIKGHASRRTMRITELCKATRYRLLLTGTPISQGVEDLYAQMRFLSPEILGYNSFYQFAHHHLEYSEKYPGLILHAHGVEKIAGLIAPYIYQVTKAECMTLPDKLYDSVYCNLTEEQHAAYAQAKDEILTSAEELDSYTIFKLLTALQQIVSGFWNRDGHLLEFPENRLEQLLGTIAAISDDEKVIIWCKYIYSLKKIAAALPGCALYYGDLSEKERAGQLEKFKAPGCRFLVATQATGGHGLTLNEAHYHIFYENEFKYSHRIQAEDRSHRIGQQRPVTYIDVLSNSGIDNRIQKALAKKENVVNAFKREIKTKDSAVLEAL